MSHLESACEDDFDFEFSSGALCLDFVNTLPDRPICEKERLTSLPRLLSWVSQAKGALPEGTIPEDCDACTRQSGGPQLLEEAVCFRECLYRIFSRLAGGREFFEEDILLFNRMVKRALSQLRMTEKNGVFRWTFDDVDVAQESFLWPVARSAAELLVSEEASLIRECGSDRCSWLFLDRSRTKRRRWCDMTTCGNRAKAKRFYERHKQG